MTHIWIFYSWNIAQNHSHSFYTYLYRRTTHNLSYSIHSLHVRSKNVCFNIKKKFSTLDQRSDNKISKSNRKNSSTIVSLYRRPGRLTIKRNINNKKTIPIDPLFYLRTLFLDFTRSWLVHILRIVYLVDGCRWHSCKHNCKKNNHFPSFHIHNLLIWPQCLNVDTYKITLQWNVRKFPSIKNLSRETTTLMVGSVEL